MNGNKLETNAIFVLSQNHSIYESISFATNMYFSEWFIGHWMVFCIFNVEQLIDGGANEFNFGKNRPSSHDCSMR